MNKEDSKILVLEDDILVRSDTCEKLNLLGYESIPAQNSIEALEVLKREKQKIKLIITEIELTDNIGGFEFIKQVASKHKFVVGIIVISRYQSLPHFQKYLNIEKSINSETPHNTIMLDNLAKPISMIQLRNLCLTATQKITEERIKQDRLNKNEEVGLILENGIFKLTGFTHDNSLRLLDPNDNNHNLFYTYTFESITLGIAIKELEHLINNTQIREADLQDFFTRYPDFLKKNEYKEIHPHLILKSEANKKLIPDFVLEPINKQALSDILDLKLPKQKVYVGNNRLRYSAEINKVCSQLKEYSAFFENDQNRQKVKQKYGLELYSPKMITVIGRRQEVDPILIKRINQTLPNLTVKNYDDIVDEMKFRIR